MKRIILFDTDYWSVEESATHWQLIRPGVSITYSKLTPDESYANLTKRLLLSLLVNNA